MKLARILPTPPYGSSRPVLTNSGGNLCLHLIGNLRHFIGHLLGGGNYARDREYEFNAKDLTRAQLLDLINTCQHEFDTGLANIETNRLGEIALQRRPVMR